MADRPAAAATDGTTPGARRLASGNTLSRSSEVAQRTWQSCATAGRGGRKGRGLAGLWQGSALNGIAKFEIASPVRTL